MAADFPGESAPLVDSVPLVASFPEIISRTFPHRTYATPALSFLALISLVVSLSFLLPPASLLLPSDRPSEPNPPPWPASVRILDPSDAPLLPSLVRSLSSDLLDRRTGHFSSRRLAFLFLPGRYSGGGSPFDVGYYVTVAGLGRSPSDVAFAAGEGPRCRPADLRLRGAGALDTFWRALENVATEGDLTWAASQASPLRRIRVGGGLDLFEGFCLPDEEDGNATRCGAYYASGGFLADSVVEGTADFGSQQQYLSRNVDFRGGAKGGAWSLVFVGCGAPADRGPPDAPRPTRTVDDRPRVAVEKPYLAAENDVFSLVVPRPRRGDGTRRAPFRGRDEEVRDFSSVRLVLPDHDLRSVQAALDAGLDLVLSPAVYRFDGSLVVSRDGTVVLGLGMATLVAPSSGAPALRVLPHVAGVRLAGLLLEAAPLSSAAYPRSSLLVWGEEGDPGDPNDPGVLSDVFFRAGGTPPRDRRATVETMLRINSGNVVIDHVWLWRPDHLSLREGEGADGPARSEYHPVRGDECRCDVALEVAGDDVTAYGLAAEHVLGDMVRWEGDRGVVRFYQSELPYDVDESYNGVSYKVGEGVAEHDLAGGGVYSFFRDHAVTADMAFRRPHGGEDVNMTNVFTRFLDGMGSIRSVVNGEEGDPVNTTHRLSRVALSAG